MSKIDKIKQLEIEQQNINLVLNNASESEINFLKFKQKIIIQKYLEEYEKFTRKSK